MPPDPARSCSRFLLHAAGLFHPPRPRPSSRDLPTPRLSGRDLSPSWALSVLRLRRRRSWSRWTLCLQTPLAHAPGSSSTQPDYFILLGNRGRDLSPSWALSVLRLRRRRGLLHNRGKGNAGWKMGRRRSRRVRFTFFPAPRAPAWIGTLTQAVLVCRSDREARAGQVMTRPDADPCRVDSPDTNHPS
jgi:hypothetical protein